MKHQRISEFAKAIGVSHTAVGKAIKTGRIPPNLVSLKETGSGRRVRVITNPAAARAAYLGAADASTAGSSQASGSEQTDDDGVPSIATSRRISEMYRARLARLEFEEKAGRLIDREQFLTKFTTNIVVARTRLLGVPSKAKGQIPHLSIDDVQVLTDLIREALEDLAEPNEHVRALVAEVWKQWRVSSTYEPTLLTTPEELEDAL